MASALLGFQATFALGAHQIRRSHVRLSPAPEKTHVLRSTSRIFRGRVCSSSVASSRPPEGPGNGKARTGSCSKAAGLQALAVAAACAVGASVCLSRAAAMPSAVSPPAPAMPSAVSAPAPASAGEERGTATSRLLKTQHLLDEIMLRREDSCKNLLDYAFRLLPGNHFQLLQQTISKGAIRITDRDITNGEEKYEIEIAIVQIYIAMHKYQKAKKVLEKIDAMEHDSRIHLLRAVLDMILAVDLIESAKESWKRFDEVNDELGKPPIPSDSDN